MSLEDVVAVGAVSSELVSARIPVNREIFREPPDAKAPRLTLCPIRGKISGA
jgi:hypothetical protein